MFKNDVRVNSPLNKSPMSTKSFLAIVTACLDSSSSVRLSASLLKQTLEHETFRFEQHMYLKLLLIPFKLLLIPFPDFCMLYL